MVINIEQKFDILGRYKYPKLKLCKPNRQGQGYINTAYGLKIKRNFNDVDELSFDIDWLLDGKENPLYSKITGSKVIFAEQYGYFIITDTPILGDGITERKTVKAVSAEFEIAKSKLSRIEDTIKLYNPLNANDDSTILGMFVKKNPKWRVGTVDSDLWNIYRTFNVQTSDWYNFLINECEEKYMCIFKFDTVNRLIHCHTPEKSVKLTNIFASYDNLIDTINVEEKFSEVFTALNCTGGGYLDIRGVNPIGGNIVYNLKFYKNEEYLNKILIDKITLWEEKIAVNQKPYREILTSVRETQVALTTAQTTLTELEGQIKAKEQAIGMAISGADNDSNRYATLISEKNAILSQIGSKNSEITSLKLTLEAYQKQATAVTDLLSFENNFTADEISQLQDIIIQDNYQNDAFAKTDILTQYEIQDLSQQLYDQSVQVLDRICEPRYYFRADLINFIFLKEYESFTKQADVGTVITAEIKKGWRSKVVMLSMELDFDNPENFTVEFSNRYRLDNGEFNFSDLFTESSRSSTSYDWDKLILGDPVKSGKFTQVTDFMNGNFNAALNALVTAQDIGVTMDGSGLHIREYVAGVLQPCEMWMIGGMIAMSDNNFNSPPRVAIGRFKLPNSENFAYGVNAEFLAGKLIVGNQFIFEAENGSFQFDGSGAKLVNAIFEVTDKHNIKRVLIDPQNGFKIQGRINPDKPWEDKIYLDNEGNAVFKGKLEALEGVIGGWEIREDGLYSPFGDYIKADGSGKLGLMTYKVGSARFDGNIYAKNLRAGGSNGYVDNSHMQDNSISGNKLEASYRDGITSSLAQISIKADQNSSSITSLTSYTNQQFGYVNQNIASITQKVDANGSSIYFMAQNINQQGSRIASIEITANNTSGSVIRLSADVINLDSKVVNMSNLVSQKASISQLNSVNAKVDNLSATKASIYQLDSVKADVRNIISGGAHIAFVNAQKVSTMQFTLSNSNIYLRSDTISGKTIRYLSY